MGKTAGLTSRTLGVWHSFAFVLCWQSTLQAIHKWIFQVRNKAWSQSTLKSFFSEASSMAYGSCLWGLSIQGCLLFLWVNPFCSLHKEANICPDTYTCLPDASLFLPDSDCKVQPELKEALATFRPTSHSRLQTLTRELPFTSKKDESWTSNNSHRNMPEPLALAFHTYSILEHTSLPAAKQILKFILQVDSWSSWELQIWGDWSLRFCLSQWSLARLGTPALHQTQHTFHCHLRVSRSSRQSYWKRGIARYLTCVFVPQPSAQPVSRLLTLRGELTGILTIFSGQRAAKNGENRLSFGDACALQQRRIEFWRFDRPILTGGIEIQR